MAPHNEDGDALAGGSPPEKVSKLGKFIQTYRGFLSSFVIGVAGLFAPAMTTTSPTPAHP